MIRVEKVEVWYDTKEDSLVFMIGDDKFVDFNVSENGLRVSNMNKLSEFFESMIKLRGVLKNGI